MYPDFHELLPAWREDGGIVGVAIRIVGLVGWGNNLRPSREYWQCHLQTHQQLSKYLDDR
jgi:hypothetical protein